MEKQFTTNIKQIRHEKPLREKGYFAHLNKNNTMQEYENEVSKGDYSVEDVKVIKTIEVDSVTFEGLKHTFLVDLDIWEKIGGHEIKPEAESKNPELWKEIQETEGFWNLSKEAVEFFRNNPLTIVVKVVCPEHKKKWNNGGHYFYVNTEGYGYARYVGLSEERFNKLMYWNVKDDLDNERDVSNMDYEEYIEKLERLQKFWKQETESEKFDRILNKVNKVLDKEEEE